MPKTLEERNKEYRYHNDGPALKYRKADVRSELLQRWLYLNCYLSLRSNAEIHGIFDSYMMMHLRAVLLFTRIINDEPVRTRSVNLRPVSRE